MKSKVFIVVGVGRSGTSTTARILHNNLNVNMGHKFPKPTEDNPKGFWDDMNFKEFNQKFLDGKITLFEWWQYTEKLIALRGVENEVWGFKDTKLAYLLGLFLTLISNPNLIYCKRDSKLVIDSLYRCYKPIGWTRDFAEHYYHYSTRMIERTLVGRDYLTIDLGKEKISDNEIEKIIKNKFDL